LDESAGFHSKPKEVTLIINSNERIIKHKIGLLNLADELGNASQVCKMMGLLRDTSYRYQGTVEAGSTGFARQALKKA